LTNKERPILTFCCYILPIQPAFSNQHFTLSDQEISILPVPVLPSFMEIFVNFQFQGQK